MPYIGRIMKSSFDFYAPNGGVRPVRLCEDTRRFAHDSLNRRYGLDTLEVMCVDMDGEKNFESLSPLEKYDRCIRAIAEHAPIRICEGERISGAATLGRAISHVVPADFGGEAVFGSISHLTTDFESVLRFGVNDMKRRALEALELHRGTEREAFARSCVSCLESFGIWHGNSLGRDYRIF